jgi:hypothetical protein
MCLEESDSGGGGLRECKDLSGKRQAGWMDGWNNTGQESRIPYRWTGKKPCGSIVPGVGAAVEAGWFFAEVGEELR